MFMVIAQFSNELCTTAAKLSMAKLCGRNMCVKDNTSKSCYAT